VTETMGIIHPEDIMNPKCVLEFVFDYLMHGVTCGCQLLAVLIGVVMHMLQCALGTMKFWKCDFVNVIHIIIVQNDRKINITMKNIIFT
jgi:hypothetical protein